MKKIYKMLWLLALLAVMPVANVVAQVAKIGDTEYATLEEAVAAAEDGATITLLADCAGNGIKAPQGKFGTNGLTVDFANHTYTVNGNLVGSTGTESQAFQLLKGNNITFKNGTITSEKAKILVQNYSNLTLKGMTLTLNNPNYAYAYTLSNNNGNVVIDGTTINANPAGAFAFDVCRYSSYPSVSVEVKGSSVINGNVEVSASSNSASEGLKLTLTSGEINGAIVVDPSATAAMAATPEVASITKAEEFKVYVAQIGTEKYESLAEAVEAVPANGTATITVIANQKINIVGSAITIPANKNVVLDLNGYQVVGTAEEGSTSALITNKGTLTIKDSSDTNKDGTGTGKLISGATPTWIYDGSGNFAGSYASNTITNSGTLTIESGYIENLSTGSATYAVDNNSSGGNAILNMNGGVLKAHSVAVRQFANSTTLENTVNVDGGTVTAGYSGIWIQLPGSDASKAMKAALNVTGGTLDGGSYAFYDTTQGNAYTNTQYNLSGGTFNGAVFNYGGTMEISEGNGTEPVFNGNVSRKGGDLTISGGTFNGYVYTYGTGEFNAVSGGTFNQRLYPNTNKEFISGGTFAYDPTDYCVDGYIHTINNDGTYGVKVGSYVAEIDGFGFETLEEAIAAAEDGETVTLLADCSGNGIQVPQGKFTTGLTVDFNGKTYTMDGEMVGSTGTKTQAFQLLKDNTITFTNGTIYSEKAKMLVQNYSNLTLNNMVLTLNNQSYTNPAYTLSNNNGNTVINNTTINANNDNSFAFDVCRYSSYPSVGVTVQGTSVINGDVEIYASKGQAKDGLSLNLNGGTMTGDIVVDATAATIIETTPEKAVVTKADAFDKTAPEGFKWESNGDGTSTLVEDIYVLADGTVYTEAAERQVPKAVYKRTFGDDRAGVFQAWMVPFNYTITATDAENFDFYDISAVEHAEGTKMQLRISPLAADDVLDANKPYVFMPKSAVGEYSFTAKNAILTVADPSVSRKQYSLSDGSVDFYGVYESASPAYENDYIFYMSKIGKISRGTKTITKVDPCRWIFRITDANGNNSSVAYTFGFAFDDDDDVTAVSSAAADSAESEVVGYYTLNGQKVSEPTKGVYVVKYANGTSKKVVF